MESHPASPNVVPIKSGQKPADLLHVLRANALHVLPPMLADVLGRVDDALFDLVQRSSSSFEQQQYFDAMRELRRQRTSVEMRYRDHVGAAFLSIEKRHPVIAQYAQAGDASSGLSLLDEAELEEQLAAEQVAQAIERRHATVLGHLDRQLSQLTGLVIDGTVNPIGPGHVAAALRAALRGCEVSSSSRLVLFKLYEQAVLPGLTGFYNEQQRVLASAGLGTAPPAPRIPVIRPGMSERRAPESAHSATDPSAPSEHYGPSATHSAGGASRVARGDESPVREDLFSALHGLLEDYRAVQRSLSSSADGAAPGQAGAAAPGQGSRADIPPLAAEQTLTALSLLQRELPASVQAAVDDPKLSLAGQIKRELMAQAERMGLGAPGAVLTGQDEDAIDLVGMLFEVLLAERKFQDEVRGLFTQLIVPFTKVAMIDRRMFMQKTHPARRMLNAVAEACDGNHGETALERELLDRVQTLIERLVSEFNEDIAIFEALQEEFTVFLEQHRKRVELAERRAAEAQRGRERLEQARAVAVMELAMLIGAREAPPIVDSFLRRYWTHHLSVVVLRDGVESERFVNARELGVRLWNTMLACESGTVRRESLAPIIEPVLASSGVTGSSASEIVTAIEKLFDAMGAGDRERVEVLQVEALPATDTSAPPPAIPIETAASSGADDAGAEGAEESAAISAEAGDIERIRKLQVGSWVEMMGDDGTVQPAKLSWVSPISSRLLFVNRRGVRVCAASAEELAVMLKQGKLSLRGIDTAFERAMTQVLGKLRETQAQKEPR